MKTAINLYFNRVDTMEKLKEIKRIGYDQIHTGIYDKVETISFEEQMEYFKKNNIKLSMIHCSYNEPIVNNFWLDNEIGESITDDYIKQIEKCGAYTNNFVVHLNGSKESVVSQIGLKRIKKMLKTCEKYNINLCIENLYSSEEIPFVFSKLNHPNLKICYDSGHKNFLTPDFAICEKYGKYISVLHLHENNGTKDEHKKLTIGSPVYNRLVRELALVGDDVVLSSEIRCGAENWQEYIKENLNSLQSLSKDIEKNKQANIQM